MVFFFKMGYHILITCCLIQNHRYLKSNPLITFLGDQESRSGKPSWPPQKHRWEGRIDTQPHTHSVEAPSFQTLQQVLNKRPTKYVS